MTIEGLIITSKLKELYILQAISLSIVLFILLITIEFIQLQWISSYILLPGKDTVML